MILSLGKIHLKIDFFKEKSNPAYGITNRCKDGKYILFLDYDNIPLDWIIDELKYIQIYYKLSSIYIFSTDHGFHAICFDKLPLYKVVDIMRSTSIDPNYANIPLKFGRKLWTLRLSKKEDPIKIVAVIESNSRREKSYAHSLFIAKWHKIHIPLDIHDNQKEFIGAWYKI